MRKLLVAILFIPLGVNAQDIHFTQLNEAPMLLNPSYAGMFQGWERVAVNHKNQWVGAGTKFFTTSIAADMNLFKPKRGDRAHMGVGVQFFNDIGGDSKFGTKQFNVNLSGIVPVAEMHTIAAGIQFGIAQKSGDLNSLSFANQFNGTEFDPAINANEVNGLVSFMYSDFGAGLSYRYGNTKLGFARDDATDFRIGVSYFHLNKPNISYSFGFKESLYAKIGINTSFLKDIEGSPVGFHLMFNQFLQGPHSETMLGALLRYRLNTGSKTTGLTRDAYLSGGLYFRVKDAVAPALFVELSGFKFGVSYDITLSELGNVSRGGGLEFSLSFTNMDFALFKRRRR